MSMTIDFSGKTVLVTGADAEGYLLVNRIHGFGFCEGDYRTVFMHRRWSDIRKVKSTGRVKVIEKKILFAILTAISAGCVMIV